MTRWRRLGGVPLLLLAAATPASDPARAILTPPLCPATANYDSGLLILTERSSAARPDTPIVHQRQWQVDARSGLVRMQIDEQSLRNGNNSAPVRAMRTQRTLTAE